MMQHELNLPEEDLRWLTFVQRFENIAREYPEFIPLRRCVYGSVYEEKRNMQPLVGSRQYPGLVKHSAISLYNLLTIMPVDILLWQDTERSYMYETINLIQILAHQTGLTTCVLLKPMLAKRGLTERAKHIYPLAIRRNLPTHARYFSQTIVRQFQQESLVNLAPYLEKYLRDYFGYSRIFHLVIRKLKPKLIMFMNDQFLASATLAKVVRKYNIPSYVLQHGAPNPFQYPLQADKLLAWGEKSKRYFMQLHMPESQITVSGSVLHDKIQFHKNTRVSKKRILLISNGNNTDRNGELPKIAYEWLALLKREDENYEIYVRYHPDEWDIFKRLGEQFNMSLNATSLHDALRETDVVVGYVSTALLEGSLTGRPVIQLLDQSASHLCDYWKDGIAVGVHNYPEFKAAVRNICGNDLNYYAVVEKQRAIAKQHFYNHGSVGHALFSMLKLEGVL
ncbi:MAG: hypothetical protein ACOYYS_27635 [Chloroflexota bacterium]